MACGGGAVLIKAASEHVATKFRPKKRKDAGYYDGNARGSRGGFTDVTRRYPCVHTGRSLREGRVEKTAWLNSNARLWR